MLTNSFQEKISLASHQYGYNSLEEEDTEWSFVYIHKVFGTCFFSRSNKNTSGVEKNTLLHEQASESIWQK